MVEYKTLCLGTMMALISLYGLKEKGFLIFKAIEAVFIAGGMQDLKLEGVMCPLG